MPITIDLIGRSAKGKWCGLTGAEQWLQTAEQWLRDRCGDMLLSIEGDCRDGAAGLHCIPHPCAEDIEFRVTRQRLRVSASTSQVGPGYHQFVTDLLREMGREFGIAWGQPAERGASGGAGAYYRTGDREALERAMLNWLGAVTHRLIELHAESPGSMSAISMPADYIFKIDTTIKTPLGPRDERWLKMTAANPRRGIDIFPWWSPEQDASYYLHRALTEMWTDVRWREAFTEEEAETQTRVLANLKQAYRLDPTLGYPWREWAELIEFGASPEPLLHDIRELAMAAPASRFLIGYRRGDVECGNLPGRWSITVPGRFAEEWEEDNTWAAWDETRSVRVSSLSVGDSSSPPSPERLIAGLKLDEGGEALEHRRDSLVGRARIRKCEEMDDEKEGWELQGVSAVPGKVAICTIRLENENDSTWAAETWRSLIRRGSEDGE